MFIAVTAQALVRVDGGRRLGMGHLVRVDAPAEALEQQESEGPMPDSAPGAPSSSLWPARPAVRAEDVVRLFAMHPEALLVVRVRPAEMRVPGWQARDGLVSRLTATSPVLPGNVRVVPRNSDLSSYTLMRLAGAGLVFTATAGLPVVVALRRSIQWKGLHVRSRRPRCLPAKGSRVVALSAGPRPPRIGAAVRPRVLLPLIPAVPPVRRERLRRADAEGQLEVRAGSWRRRGSGSDLPRHPPRRRDLR